MDMEEPVNDNGVEVQEDKRTTRRTVKAKRGVNESAKKALEDLNRIKKDGGKRDYEVREEAPIYSEVDEAEYRKLTEEKRSKMFVEDDDGLGYDDYGEDDLGFDDDEEDEEDSTSGKKKKAANGDSKLGKKRKRAQRKQETSVPSQRITDMFLNPKQSTTEGKTPTKKLKTGAAKPDENTPINAELEALFADIKKNPLAPAAPVPIAPPFKKVTSEPAKVPFKEVDANTVSDNTNTTDAKAATKPADKPVANGSDKPKESASSTATGAAKSNSAAAKVVDMSDIEDDENNAAKYQAEEDAEAAKYTGDDWFALKEKDQDAGADIIAQNFGPAKSIDELPKTSNGEVLFYWLDAQDDQRGAPGTIYMFGKVYEPKTKQFLSCALTVRGVERTIYVVPKQNSGEVDAEGNPIPVKVEEVQKEFMTVRNNHGSFDYKSRKVAKNYAFEIEDIPRKKNIEVLEVVYPYSAQELPADLKGNTFSHILGNVSALENFIIQRKLMGPGWVSLKNVKANSGMKSWCKFECSIDSPTHLTVVYDNLPPVPPVTICSLKVQTVVNQSNKVNEIIAVGLLFKRNVNTEVPTPIEQTQKDTSDIVFLRKPQGHTLPLSFSRYLTEHKLENNIIVKPNERDLLNSAMEMIGNFDPDMLVGHNINGYDLDVLLHRMHDLQCVSWSKLGRLNQKNMPHLKKTGINNKGESNYTKRKVTIGRLVCDTYHSAKELIKSKDYTLSTLARTKLNTNRQSVNSDKMPSLFGTTEDLLYFCRLTTNDAFLTLKLMFKLNVLPLTKQLTQVSGNLWYRSLTGARAERIEYLLLHEFYAHNYMLPDKAKLEEGGEGFTKKKQPAYEGGLVLEPKKGLYDKYILLLDFQSLYPSIIQEYNICFTTIDRKKDPADPKKWQLSDPPPQGTSIGILPTVIRSLVQRRRAVKEKLGAASDSNTKSQLEIQQLALKLVANSMYGCLGFSNSRFMAMPLAELVTRKGRENLQKTVDIATKKLGLEVIYGDTDSIMINTGLDSYKAVQEMGSRIKKEVNNSNAREGEKSTLEIEVDGIFKTMLLCKKKKYAAVRAGGSDGTQLSIEKKGLDLVRRDWCELSHEMGEYVLDKILKSSAKDEVVDNIHGYLRGMADDIRQGKVPLKKFAITKSLTKSPEDYKDDSKAQPHVQVALAMRKEGQSVRVGDVIPYIICKVPDADKSTLMGARAFHPETVKKLNLQIDLEWYFAAQIYPPIARLIEPLDGTDNVLIAQCLGLDPTKFGIRLNNAGVDSNVALPSLTDDTVKYKDVEKLVLKCPSCSKENEFLGVWHKASEEDKSMGIFACTLCQNCKRQFSGAAITNAVTLATRKHIGRYYSSPYQCDERTCAIKTREFNLKSDGQPACPRKGCSGTMSLEYDKNQLYTQLRYFQDMFDWMRLLDKLDMKDEKQREERLILTAPEHQRIRDYFENICTDVTVLLQQNGYGVVDCAQLFGFFKL